MLFLQLGYINCKDKVRLTNATVTPMSNNVIVLFFCVLHKLLYEIKDKVRLTNVL